MANDHYLEFPESSDENPCPDCILHGTEHQDSFGNEADMECVFWPDEAPATARLMYRTMLASVTRWYEEHYNVTDDPAHGVHPRDNPY